MPQHRIAAMTVSPHTSAEFERELDALAARLVAMGTRSEHQLARAARAVIDRDDRAADEVIIGDAAIHQDEKDVDEQATRLLARWHPVARDLRVIAVCLKAVTHLERIGALAVNCAQRARELNRLEPLAWHFDIEPLALAVLRALHALIAALASEDAQAARCVLAETGEVDRLHAKLHAQLLAHIATDPATITSVLPLTSTCRYLGHAADHIRSLAGEIIYMVSAEHHHHAAV
jgi:phosphate transport system protein